MKKYSRSFNRKVSKQSLPSAQEKLSSNATEAATCGSGDGHVQEEKNMAASLVTPEVPCQIPVSTSHDRHTLSACADTHKDQVGSDSASLGVPVPRQSASDTDTTQYDLISLDGVDSGQHLPLPLSCVWGNGMQFQSPNYEIPSSLMQLTLQAPTATIPLPPTMLHLPKFNHGLPFPDRSGSINSFAAAHNSMMQPPVPTLNASLGFPSVYVSPAGLITVLLKFDVAVEMTVDKNIRVVNHRHKAVAATNNRGSTNCVYHVAAKVFQDGTRTEVEAFGERRARMQTNGILFASGTEAYLLDDCHIVPSQFAFSDMSKDSSVNVLFTPGMAFTNELLVHCDEITKGSRYYFHKDGSTTIIINNIKIHQDENGEVQVVSGRRNIFTSPVYGAIYLQTHFVEISVQVNWNVCVLRGTQRLTASYTNLAVCNGQHEAGFNQYREVFSRVYNPTLSEFENWLPSLTYLSQGLPQTRRNYMNTQNYNKDFRNKGDGDQTASSHSL
ncbi:uncharacterized protein [Watersipora subatra]|uniref:uncharacterized protein n=1 Tax=Watersipora subatra TaxID=2589382 RepID=UPI00355BB2B9